MYEIVPVKMNKSRNVSNEMLNDNCWLYEFCIIFALILPCLTSRGHISSRGCFRENAVGN